MMTQVIGLISGTSVDGIDAALVEICGTDVDLKVKLLSGATYPYPAALREQILEVCGGAPLSMAELAQLDDAIALEFAQAAQKIQTGDTPAELIGSHGQTVYHRPRELKVERLNVESSNQQPSNLQPSNLQPPNLQPSNLQPPNLQPSNLQPSTLLGYSLQLGRGEVIAQLTGIKTVSNFRVADIAAGGQGAPLVPKVDAYLLSSPTQHRCIQNIGGIGNVTYLPARQGNWLAEVCGWDTGPGNALLDLAVEHFTNGSQTYDKDGSWARSGIPCKELVEQWLSEDFFQVSPPKSTGRELFGLDYLKRCLTQAEIYNLTAADMLATLTELSVSSIVHSYRSFLPQMPDEVLLCGGGSRNIYLKQRLQDLLEPVRVLTTDEVGVSADFKEAIAFAVLAHWRYLGIPGNLPQVTGARAAVPLGNVYFPIGFE
jgi:anhydro-N-acetylmuramic acid kinase